MQGRINQSFLQVQLNSVCFFVSLVCSFLPADFFSEFIFIYKHIGRIYLDDEIYEKASPRAVQLLLFKLQKIPFQSGSSSNRVVESVDRN